MSKFSKYVSDSYQELMERVTWPTWSNLQQSTMVVLGATVIITLVVWLMDFVSSGSLNFIYGLFKK